MQSRREEWAGRVAGWRRSGLTAKQFAASIGVNAGTLTYWAWHLGSRRGERELRRTARRVTSTAPATLIEVVNSGTRDDRFELRLHSGHHVHIPAGFEAAALKRLLDVLEVQR